MPVRTNVHVPKAPSHGMQTEPKVRTPTRVRRSSIRIPDDTPVPELGFLSAHNSFQGRMQVLACPAVRHLDDCLRRNCRAIELDVFPGRNQHPIVRHAWCFGGFPWITAMERIRDLAFVEHDMPMIVFVDVRAPAPTMDLAAKHARTVLGDRLCVASSLSDLTLGDVRGKVVFVTFPRVDGADMWNALRTDSMYRRGFENRRHTDPEWEKFGIGPLETSLDGNARDTLVSLSRVYPRNVLWSSNFDPRPWVGRTNFVALNWGRPKSRHLNTLLGLFEESNGVLPLDELDRRVLYEFVGDSWSDASSDGPAYI